MRNISSLILIAAVVACGEEANVTEPVEALAHRGRVQHYEVVKVTANLGGTDSRGQGINNLGLIAGFSNQPGNLTRHAALWRDGEIRDLGTLGGPNSNAQWPGINNRGMVVGISETAAMDTLGQEWSCSAFFPTITHHICLGFFWDNGVMTALPTLGGDNGFATGVNNRGQVVGWAETPVHDPTCNAPQVLQFSAVRWEPRRDRMMELPPLPGDSTSAATAINQRGQIVGISGDCGVAVGSFSALHAVLWDKKGRVTEIPNLGGVTWHTPMAINERGDVVGFSNPPGPGDPEGAFIAHAFLWKSHSNKAIDLGTLGDDALSQAMGINSRRQIVGVSFGGVDGPRAFLWEDGHLMNLNDLVESEDVLISAQHINDRGEITGRLLDSVTGETIPFVARPARGRK